MNYVQSWIFVDRWLFLVGIITCINSSCGVHLSVVPISSYERNNGRRRFKTGFRAGFPMCLEVFVVWEITPTQRSFPISTVAALLRKHISCSYRSTTCSIERTTERLSTHRRRRSLHAGSHCGSKLEKIGKRFQVARACAGRDTAPFCKFFQARTYSVAPANVTDSPVSNFSCAFQIGLIIDGTEK